MNWPALICLMVFVIVVVIFYWRELSRDTKEYPRAWLMRWMRRGLLAPMVVWIFLNLGKTPVMPPLTRQVGLTRGPGLWNVGMLQQVTLATIAIVCFWAFVTFADFITNVFKRAENKEELVVAAVIWGLTLPIFFSLLFAGGGWDGGAVALVLWVVPLTHYFLEVGDIRPPLPTYSNAIAKINFGKYSDAEESIIAQLEKCETDFDGWMMLADLYANHFDDISEAEKTICALCDEPSMTVVQISIALHKLADWQLHLRHDPVAARRVLEEICRRMPGTHLALMAQLRIDNLPKTTKELEQQQQPKKVPLRVLLEDSEASKATSTLSADEAVSMANQYVQQLTRDPDDIDTREKFARILAGPLANLEQAIEQLQLLLDLPDQPSGKVASWLNLMASWIVERDGECEEAQALFEKVIETYPQTPQAFTAQRRLSLMRVIPGVKGNVRRRRM